MSYNIRIATIGDFEGERPSHKATNEAFNHGAESLGFGVTAIWIPTKTLVATGTRRIGLEEYDGIFCTPGGPYRSMNGVLEAIRFARERGWPFLGT